MNEGIKSKTILPTCCEVLDINTRVTKQEQKASYNNLVSEKSKSSDGKIQILFKKKRNWSKTLISKDSVTRFTGS